MNGEIGKIGKIGSFGSKRIKRAFAAALAVGALAAAVNSVGCSDDSNPTAAVIETPDGWIYYASYPNDLGIASYYWVDDWDFATLYFVSPVGPVTTVADAIRALARGEDVCGSAAAVTARTRTPVCTGGPTQSRGGATIVFDNCVTAGGGTINGTVDISSSGTASSAACDGTTMITTSHTTTITNLAYVAPNGVKAVIPSQTDTGTNTYAFGSAPAMVRLSTSGQLQTFTRDGALFSDTSYQGSPTITFGGVTPSYAINGTFDTTNNLVSGAGATYTLSGITRVASCCRPVAGTLTTDRTSGVSSAYTFGPTCGQVLLDGAAVSVVPDCF